MKNEVNIIQQHPFGLGVAFNTVRALANFGQVFLHVIGNRLYLARVGAGADDKIISKRSAALIHFKDDNVFTLLALNGLHRLCNLLPGL